MINQKLIKLIKKYFCFISKYKARTLFIRA